jgi:hypothetical protein
VGGRKWLWARCWLALRHEPFPAAAAERGENSGGSAGEVPSFSAFGLRTTNGEAGKEPPASPLTSISPAHTLFSLSIRASQGRPAVSVHLSACLPTVIHATRVSTLVHAGCYSRTAEGDDVNACSLLSSPLHSHPRFRASNDCQLLLGAFLTKLPFKYLWLRPTSSARGNKTRLTRKSACHLL